MDNVTHAPPSAYIPMRPRRPVPILRAQEEQAPLGLDDYFLMRAHTLRPHSLMGPSHPFNRIVEANEAVGFEPSRREQRWGLALRASLGLFMLAVPTLIVYFSWRAYVNNKNQG